MPREEIGFRATMWVFFKWEKGSTTLLKTVNGEIHHVHKLENSISCRCQFPPNWFIYIMQFLSKSQQNSVLYIEKLILKFISKGEGIRIVKTILKKKNEVGEIALSEVKVYML